MERHSPNKAEEEQQSAVELLKSMKEMLKACTIEAAVTYDREQQRDLLKSRLMPGERIVWYGYPDAEYAAKRSARPFWWGASALFAGVAYLLPAHGDFLVFKGFACLLCPLFGYWGLISTNWERKQAALTLYAVTTNRALRLQSVEFKKSGTMVKWYLMTWGADDIAQPVKKRIEGVVSDVNFASPGSEDVGRKQVFSNLRDSEGAISALEKLNRTADPKRPS